MVGFFSESLDLSFAVSNYYNRSIGNCVIRRHAYIYVCCVWLIFVYLLVYKYLPGALLCVPMAHIGFDHFSFLYKSYFSHRDMHSYRAGLFIIHVKKNHGYMATEAWVYVSIYGLMDKWTEPYL